MPLLYTLAAALACISIMHLLVFRYLLRIKRFWINMAYLLLFGLACAVLALNMFKVDKSRVYVAVTGDDLSIFNPDRYVSSSHPITVDADLVVANHPAHKCIAALLHETNPSKLADTKQAKLNLLQSCFNHVRRFIFQGEVIYLDPTTRDGARGVHVALNKYAMGSWVDLAGSPCKSYRFDLSSDREVRFTLGVKETALRDNGTSRLGADFSLKLSPVITPTLKFTHVWRHESLQWEDVELVGSYDNSTTAYVSLLAELLNSPNLRQHWAHSQDLLWTRVPNDRERLRLLMLRVELGTVMVDGNIMLAQFLPDLRRMETLLATEVDSASKLISDLMLYRCMKSFMAATRSYDHLFTRRGIFQEYLDDTRSALRPACLDETGTDELMNFISYGLPDYLLTRSEIQQLLKSFMGLTMPGTPNADPTPLNPQLAWINSATWESLRRTLPAMNLPLAPASETTGFKPADWRFITPERPGFGLIVPGMGKREAKPAAEDARPPTRQRAWQTAETAFAMEFLRRVLRHAERPVNALVDTLSKKEGATGSPSEEVALQDAVVIILEGMLQQGALIDEYLDLRQRLFGDRDAWLADSPLLSYLRQSCRVHAASDQISPAAGSQMLARLNPVLDLLTWTAKSPVVIDFAGEDHSAMFTGLKESLALDPRATRVIASCLHGLDGDATGRVAMPWLQWAGQVVQDPVVQTLFSALENETLPTEAQWQALAAHLDKVPLEGSMKDALLHLRHSSARLYQEFLGIQKQNADSEDKIAGWTADALLAVRRSLYESRVLVPLADIMTSFLYADDLPWFTDNGDSSPTLQKKVRAQLKVCISQDSPQEALSPAEQHLHLFFTQMTWLRHLPEEQRPQAIVHDKETGRVTFDPPCPQLQDWIRDISSIATAGIGYVLPPAHAGMPPLPTAQTSPPSVGTHAAPPEGHAYPCIAEALMLDLYLRTLEDRTIAGYHVTEFGRPRALFNDLTQHTVESYLSELLHPPEKQEPRPAVPPPAAVPAGQ